MKLTLIIFLSVFYVFISFAQSNDWEYLPKSYVTTCFAEEGDFIWIGDYSGVVKMNRTTGEKTYYNKATCAIPIHTILCMAIDKNGVKWFGTQEHGLIRFDDKNWSFFDMVNSPLPDPTISKLVVDAENNLWIGGNIMTFGLVKFDGVNWTTYTTSNSSLPNNYIYCLLFEGNDLWASTNGGLAKYNGTDWLVYNTKNSNISDHFAFAMDKDNKGNIWLAHYSGIEKFDGKTFSFFGEKNTTMPNICITSLTIDNNNTIWTGCHDYFGEPGSVLGGIMSFDGNSWSIYDSTNSIIKEENIYSIFADSKNNIWMGTIKGNVYCKNDKTWWSYNASEVLIHDLLQIQSISFDQSNNAYIINKNELIKYDGKTWKPLNNQNEHPIAVTLDKNGVPFLRSSDGLKKFEGDKWSNINGAPLSMRRTPGQNQIAINDSGDLWIDKYRDSIDYNDIWYYHFGLARYDGTSWTYYNDRNSNLPHSSKGIIKADRNNAIWVGTSEGLAKFNGVDWAVFDTSNSNIPTNYIGDIAFDRQNNLWIPNGRFGLIKFDGTTFTEFLHPTRDSYSSSGKLAIDNDGVIWQLIGPYYLTGFDGQNWTNFSPLNSPLPENIDIPSFNIDNNGNLWIGSQMGIFKYKKGGIIKSKAKPLISYDLPIKAFPNPFDNSFEIRLNQYYKLVEINLYDIFGCIKYVEKFENVNSIQISRNNLASGMYFYQLKLDNQLCQSGKIVAQ
jgi:ligand-binding sensor domain-containing protein